jgi:adenosine/AMP kinase
VIAAPWGRSMGARQILQHGEARPSRPMANPTQVILAETEQGRGILGVIDGVQSQGIEDEAGVACRTEFLRKIGYKLGP